ncbi:MAG: hypothetical protein LYZ70_05680 [Nitrososphaerales archaeon]|nr:hypothetical protein [Nitrososphaerales archaeon]
MAERGVAVVFGPVADPKGVWGIGVIEAKDETELRKLHESDPVIKERLGHRYEIYPMPKVIMRRQRPA